MHRLPPSPSGQPSPRLRDPRWWRSSIPRLCGLCGLCGLTASCRPDRALSVAELQIEGEGDGTTDLEIEVHLFDGETGIHLGCAGVDQGLAAVRSSGRRYRGLDARFIRASTFPVSDDSPSDELTDLDVVDRTVTLVVVEDDVARCPQLYGDADDLIGVSGLVAGAELHFETKLSFNRVTHLVVRAPWE
jgi:hypothetical protein